MSVKREILRVGEELLERALGSEVKKTTKKAAKKPLAVEGRKSIIRTPDLRAMSKKEAITVARKEPHLIKDKTSKQYVGAPRGAKTKQAVTKNRQSFDKDVEAGAPGADWYTRAREFNKELAGPDPERQRRLAQEEALWSAQADPDSNLGTAIEAHNAYEMGEPLAIARTGAQADRYRVARDAGLEIPLGQKTGIYGQHLDPTMPHATTGTNDIWHARGFGFTDADGGEFSRGLSPQEHRYLDYETMLAVDRANERGMLGRNDWEAHEIQAAPWVAGKGRGLAKARNISEEEGIRQASKTYPDYADKYTAYATHEQVPYAGGEHLAGMAELSPEIRARYSADPEAQWVDGNGRDVLYDALEMYQRPALEGKGIYTPPGGVAEFNPSVVSRPLVGQSPEGVRDNSSRMMSLIESVRPYFDAQGAGAWHKVIPNAKPGDAGSLNVPFNGDVSDEQIAGLMSLGEKYGLGDVVPRGDGFTMTNFMDAPSGRETGKMLKGDFPRELDAVLPGAMPERSGLDGDYLSMYENGGENGAVTRQLLEMLEKYGNPTMLGKIEKSEPVRLKVLGNIARDARAAEQHGLAVDDRVQNARQIFADEGFAGLKNALSNGAPLPAVIPLAALPSIDASDPDQRTDGL